MRNPRQRDSSSVTVTKSRVRSLLIYAARSAGLVIILGAAVANPLFEHGQRSAVAAIPSGVERALSGTKQTQEVLEVQILLDRARHSPGVIDGAMGGNTRRAIRAYQRSSGLEANGEVTAELIASLRRAHDGEIFQTYTISEEDVRGPFVDVPSGMTGMAELEHVGFERPSELLAERFHMAESFLKALNPGADFEKAGTQILVIRPGNDEDLPNVAQVEVDKEGGELRALSADGQVIASYPATIGSNVHPSPSETLKVVAVAADPTYHFDPSGRDWGPDETLTIAAGPNNPVGVVWIDLSRDGFGIHGTPYPALIGKTSSHGCVRLTNWDAHELSTAAAKGTPVTFL